MGACTSSNKQELKNDEPKFMKKDSITQRSIRSALMNNSVFHTTMEEKGISDDQISQLIDYMILQEFNEHDVIISAGDESHDLFILDKGQCCVVDSSGQKLQGMKKGQLFGEIGFLNGTPRLATIKAERHCCVYKLNLKEYNKVINNIGLVDLKSFEFLNELTKAEKYNLSNVVKLVTFKKGILILILI